MATIALGCTEAKTDAKPTPQPTAAVDTNIPADESIAIQRDLATSSNRISQDTKRTADYTGLLVIVGAIVGGLQIVLFVFQFRYTGKAVSAAETQARAAVASAKTSETALKSGQRAYISIDEWAMTGFQPNGHIHVKFKVANSGHTPATLLEATQQVAILDQLPAVPEYGKPFPDGHIEVHPQGSFLKHLPVPRPLDADAYKGIIERRFFLFIWGYIKYQDVFGCIHTKRYGWFYNTDIRSFGWVDNPAYNVVTTDKDC